MRKRIQRCICARSHCAAHGAVGQVVCVCVCACVRVYIYILCLYMRLFRLIKGAVGQVWREHSLQHNSVVNVININIYNGGARSPPHHIAPRFSNDIRR